jgi:microcystin-dependent protein
VFDAAGNPSVSADDYDDQAANAAASAASAAAASASAGASAAAAAADRAASAVSQAAALGHRDAAALSAASAAASSTDAAASAAASAVAWNFDAGTAMADPGAGRFRLDAPAPAAATALAVSATSLDAGAPDVSDFVATWAASTNPNVKGYLTLRKRGGGGAFAIFAVRALADQGAWLRIDVTHVASAGTWAAGEGARIAFARAGDKGLDGAGTIVSIAASDGSLAIGGTPSDRTIAVAANSLTPAKLARLGTAGQVLTSNGAGADAAFQSLPPGVPAGVVVPFAGTVEPAGWLFAAGQLVSRTAYAALFAAIGTTFGAGDGSTTFALPDLRGRAAAGRDNMNGASANRLTSGGSGIAGTTLGAAGGGETHTLTAAQMPSHNHSAGVPSGGGVGQSVWFGDNGVSITGAAWSATGSTGGGGAHPNVQPTLVLNYIVKT